MVKISQYRQGGMHNPPLPFKQLGLAAAGEFRNAGRALFCGNTTAENKRSSG